ncbi:class I SAM-dependent methyltransferase [Panacibacter ginsenosidivorans]|uniref:Class I SAM-dependent methyltransferase n=1 Tax=Panacibacter ginsenosidivorans TaxID=1813871 RepID=A0A5B8VBR9_9BACT|nr:class I SAM-dependent methyltransferase [Panacibacter ginsenosidivorans]QEC67718.1 class I SAM-dependent methyltransferase [Panacibacter ginsenosidivorans]
MTHLLNKPVSFVDDQVWTVLPDSFSAPYDGKARLYEWLVKRHWYNKLFWGTSPCDYRQFAARSIMHSKGNLLDIGCGGLIHTAAIYSKTKRNVFLLDNSTEMLKRGCSRVTNGRINNNLFFLQANAFDIPFSNNSFDSVVSFGTIHLFEDKAAFVNEALRVLKVGGDFHFSTMVTERPFSKKYLTALYKRKEVGTPFNADEIMALFKDKVNAVSYTLKGSMLFIKGVK